jgi:iron complex outermembrane receptor protein
LATAANAQTSWGKLHGVVVDSSTGATLPGATVMIEGTVLGAATGEDGQFKISRIPAGLYRIVISMVGYERRSIELVIQPGELSMHLINLVPTALRTEQVVVTAGRRDQTLSEVPVSISTMAAPAIADRITPRLDQVLRYIPGVQMVEDQVNIRGSSGYARGVGSRVLLLLDGLPYLTGDTGEISWEVIPTNQIDRIEVVKGAGSALYGSSALGGVINVLTKEIPDETDVHIRLFSGFYDTPKYPEWRWTDETRFNSGIYASFSSSVESFKYLISVGRSVDDSFKDNDYYRRWNAYTKLKYSYSESGSLTLQGNVQHRLRGNFYWWKSLREPLRPAPSQTNNSIESVRGNLSFSLKQFVSPEFYLNFKGIYYGNFWHDDSVSRRNNTSESHLSRLDLQATYMYGPTNIFTFGITGYFDRINSDIFGNHPGFGLGTYVQDELAMSDVLHLSGGVRFDLERASALETASRVSPKLGIVYSPQEGTSLRASVGSGFRYPSISEFFVGVTTSVSSVGIVPNKELKPEKSWSAEVGFTHAIANNINLEGAIFHNSYTDLIEAVVDSQKFLIQFRNIVEAVVQGGEAGIRIDWYEKMLSTDFNYTYIWARDVAHNEPLRFRPRHMATAAIMFAYERMRFSADYRFSSRHEAIDDNLVRLAPIKDGDKRVDIHVVDVRTSYDLREFGLPLVVGAAVNNVLNYYYVELIGVMSPIRNFAFSIDAAF